MMIKGRKYRCDKPMADKRRKKCETMSDKCLKCFCCIAMMKNGEDCHFPFTKEGYKE